MKVVRKHDDQNSQNNGAKAEGNTTGNTNTTVLSNVLTTELIHVQVQSIWGYEFTFLLLSYYSVIKKMSPETNLTINSLKTHL